MIIDFHVHALDPWVLERSGAHNVASGFGARPTLPPPGSRMAQVYELMLDPERQLPYMDANGIAVHVLSLPTVIAGSGWAPDAETALELDRRSNDALAAAVRAHPDRFRAACTLPLQDLGTALAELERCVGELGMRVVNLPAQVGGVYLGDPLLRELWQAIAAYGIIAFIHPDGVRDPFFQRYSLWNSAGQPIEEVKVMSSLIYEGRLDEFPQVPIVISHGGGYLPHYYGRHDRNVQNMPQSAANISRMPSDYLRLLYYDTCVYSPAVLEALIESVGAERLLMGGDHPVGDPDPVGFVRSAPGLAEEQLAAILGATAEALLAAAPSGS
jgi:aminocarboxymuconate-semialdehyde decarboxylase